MGFLNKLFGKDSPQQRPGVIDFRCYSKVGIESAFRISRVFVNKVAMDVFGLGPLSAAAEQACQYFSEPCHSEGRELFLTIFQQAVVDRYSFESSSSTDYAKEIYELNLKIEPLPVIEINVIEIN